MGVYLVGKFWRTRFRVNSKIYDRSTRETSKGRALGFEAAWRVKIIDGLRRSGDKHALGLRLRKVRFGDVADHYIVDVLLKQGRLPNGKMKPWVQNQIICVDEIVTYFGRQSRPMYVASRGAIAKFNHDLLMRLCPGTADNRLSLLRAILFRAYDMDLLKAKPYVRLNRRNRVVNRFVSHEEEARLLKHCPLYVREFVTFLLDTGARKSEVLSLKWRDVDLERQPRASVMFVHTKNGDARLVPLPKRSDEVLRVFLPFSRGEDSLVFAHPARHPYEHRYGTFNAKKGDIIPISNMGGIWLRAKRTANLDDVRMHDLRHTYASRLLRGGAPLLTVARLLGHRTLKMTMRYAHLSSEGLDDAVAVLEREETKAPPWLSQ